jgi:ABC-type Fe3+ transport system substrate-binding protein
MSLNAAPAGMLEPLDKILILPEVTDVANWRSADFIYGDTDKRVFTYMNYIDFGMLRNMHVLPDLKIDTLDALLDPRLKGKISLRDASEPNFSNDMLATIVKQKGGDFLKRVLVEQQPKIYSNQQLLLTDITRGGQALSIGLDGIIVQRCKTDGGCTDAQQVKKFGIALSWGVSVPKNPPHLDAARVFINWFLGKEGQEELVRNWPKYNDAGAVSMRKDVPPSPGAEDRLPDFSNPDQYAFISSEKGAKEVALATQIFKEATGH